MQNSQPNNDTHKQISRKLPKWAWAAGAAGLIVIALLLIPGGGSDDTVTTFEAKRGNLLISVLEGGNVEAQESQIIQSEIEGREGTKILAIVEEGYQVTEQDVANGKVLVELDSSALEDRITQQEITYQSTKASLTEANNELDIQKSQNESDIKAAEQKARFAKLDFEKYMGTIAAMEILDELNLEEAFARQAAASQLARTTRDNNETPSNRQDPAVNLKTPTLGEVPANLDRMAQSENRNRNGEGRNGNRREGGRQGGGGRGGFGGEGGGRPDFSNMTDEQREQMRERFMSNMTEEQRQQMQERLQQMRESGQTPGNFGGGPGGRNGRSQGEEAESTDAPEIAGNEPEAPKVPEKPLVDISVIDFSKYAEGAGEKLGDGQAKQELRKYTDDWLVSQEEKLIAENDLAGSKRLYKENFISKNELDKSEVAGQRASVKEVNTKTALELFKKYELPKNAEEFLSLYEEALRELHRVRKTAEARLEQAQAKYASAEQRHRIEKNDLDRLKSQYAKCVIRANTPGLVVYGSAEGGRRFMREDEQIREGASVRERQTILRIPDMTKMAIKVGIHESYIKKIKKGQKAVIRLDAEPDKILEGEVTKVGVVPDSGNSWMQPDLKVYLTTIVIEGTHEWLKPGMSCKVEIKVKELQDVVYVPIQAVVPIQGEQYVFVDKPGSPERRKVTTGEFNDEFIEIKEGVASGDSVLLRLPESLRKEINATSEYTRLNDSSQTMASVQ